jgi:hypothetical protein
LVLSRAGIFDDDPAPFREDAERWTHVLRRFCEVSSPYVDHSDYLVRRIKQWTKMAHLRFRISWFDQLKTAKTLDEVFASIRSR